MNLPSFLQFSPAARRAARAGLLVWGLVGFSTLLPTARAQDTYTWNTGAGNWNTTSANWTGAGTTWVNGATSDAVIDDFLTVTLTENITAHSLTLGGQAGLSGNFTLTLAGPGSFVNAPNTPTSIAVPIGGAVGLNKTGPGQINFNAASTYTGPTTISAGILRVSTVTNALPTGTDLTISSGASFSIGTALSQQVASISGSGSIGILGGLAVVTLVIGDGGGATFFGNLVGGGNSLTVTKNGTGTQTLSGSASNYTGGTSINAGTLIAASAQAFGAGAVTVASGATWGVQGGATLPGADTGTIAGTGAAGRSGAIDNLSGNNTISGALTLSSAATVGATAGNLTLSGGLTNAGFALTLAPASGTTIASSTTGIGGAGGLVKDGAGTVTLSAANTYTGATTVNAGTLTVNGSLAADTTVTVAAGATLNGTGTIDGPVILQAGATLGGTLTFAGGVSLGNETALGQALANAAAGSTLTLSADITLTTALPAVTKNLTIDGGGHAIFNATGARAFTATAGNLTLNNIAISDDYVIQGTANVTGTSVDPFTIGDNAAGSLSLGAGGKLNTVNASIGTSNDSTAIVTGAGSQWNSTVFITVGAGATGDLQVLSGGKVSPAKTIVGNASNGTVTVDGAGSELDGSLMLGVNTGNATLAVTNGGLVDALQVDLGFDATDVAEVHVNAAGPSKGTLKTGQFVKNATTATIDIDGGIVQAGAASADFMSGFGPGDVTIAAGGATVDTNNFDVEVLIPIDGAGALTKQGAGTLTLAAANSFSGGTTVSAGTLALGNADALGTGGVTVAGGATLDFNGLSVALGALAGGGTYALGAGTLTVGGDDSDTTFAGVIGGAGGLTKTGTGDLNLTGANLYTGATTIDAGQLSVNGSLAAGSAVTMAGGSTLGGAGTIAGAVTAASGGTVAPGNSLGTLTVGSFTWNAGATMAFELDADGASSDQLAITGALTKSGSGMFGFDFQGTGVAGSYTLMTFGSQSGFSASDFSFTNLGGGLAGGFQIAGNTLVFNAGSAPAITSAASAAAGYEEPFSYTITATGGATVFGATGLPSGLTVNAVTGAITGSSSGPGTYQVTVSAATAGGITGTAPLAIRIGQAGAQVTLGALNRVYDGQPKAAAIVTDPPGLSLNVLYLLNGSVVAAPTAAGVYTVLVSTADPVYSGSALGTLTIAPAVTGAPAKASATVGGTASFSVGATGGGALSYQWKKNGVDIPGATGATLDLANVQPADVGLYSVVVTGGGAAIETASVALELEFPGKLAGAGEVVGADIVHPNGNVYDQVQLTGSAVSVKADPGKVLRVSYVDLSDDIVQVEFSGAGILTVSLDNASGPAAAVNYNQPGVAYMKGHATVTITGGDATSCLTIFSVGKITAVNQELFRAGVAYDGFADLARVQIASADGRFAELRLGNAGFFATQGQTGIHAPGVQFAGPVYVHDIGAADAASPVLRLGAADDVRITGGSLRQDNNAPVEVSGMTRLQFTGGQDSHGALVPAQPNRARLMRDGVEVTDELAGP